MKLRHKRIACRWKAFTAFICFAAVAVSQPRVQLGNEVLVAKELQSLQNTRVGLITNHTGRLSSGDFLVDVLIAKRINVVALFGPEHGNRGEAAAGERVSDTIDAKTGIRVFSLYGKVQKPTAEMLVNVDVLVYDIQDVGVRFYTYISTMGLCMEAAAEKGIPFIVLDRPNPLGGVKFDGPIIEDSLKSFVGMYPIPVVYGLTCGELATMINEEGWLANGVKCSLTVITMEGWKRAMRWEQTGLPWIPPSPNIKTPATTRLYPATCYFEATNFSEGRGTDRPFHLIGVPPERETAWGFSQVHRSLDSARIPGLKVERATFIPQSSKHQQQKCTGFAFDVEDWDTFQPVSTGLFILKKLKQNRLLKIREASLQRLVGRKNVLALLHLAQTPQALAKHWENDVLKFRAQARKFFLYQ
jgi:uncharacterized protein YbbC (DUF1343 family)